MADEVRAGSFVDIEFMGRSLPFAAGGMRVARITDSVVLPFFLVRIPIKGYRMIVEKPLLLAKTEDEKSDLKTNVRKYVQRLEHYINLYPSQWGFWDTEDYFIKRKKIVSIPVKERYSVSLSRVGR
jgi:lauroyl/myristoyl acyltransferase